MSALQPNDRVSLPDGTLATLLKVVAPDQAIVRVGMDTRLANAATLRKVT